MPMALKGFQGIYPWATKAVYALLPLFGVSEHETTEVQGYVNRAAKKH